MLPIATGYVAAISCGPLEPSEDSMSDIQVFVSPSRDLGPVRVLVGVQNVAADERFTVWTHGLYLTVQTEEQNLPQLARELRRLADECMIAFERSLA